MKVDTRKAITLLKKDRRHGAGHLTLHALEILREAVSVDAAASSEALIATIRQAATALRQARPDMVSIANCVTQIEEEVMSASGTAKSPQRLKKAAFSIATRLMKEQEKAATAVARHGARIIAKRSIVMTCSYSSAVCSSLEAARRSGTDFKVLALQSLNNKISYGGMTAARLKEAGIPCRIIPDGQEAWHMARADLVLTGADTISPQGWLVNGSPTVELAGTARARQKTLYAVCGTSKFDLRGFLTGIYRPGAGFDLVPLEYYSGIITEDGILTIADFENMIFNSTKGKYRDGAV